VLLCVACFVAEPLRDFFRIPEELARPFALLLRLNLCSAAVTVLFAPLQQLLYIHQRTDIINYCTIGSNLVNACVSNLNALSWCWDLFLCAAAWATVVVQNVIIAFFVIRLKLLPNIRCARFSWEMARPVGCLRR